MKPWFKYSDIQPKILGSDHCPVYSDFLPINQDITNEDVSNYVSPLLASNFTEFKQNKLSSYFTKPSSNPPMIIPSAKTSLSTTLSTSSTPTLKRLSTSIPRNTKQSKKLKSTKKEAPNTAFMNYFTKKQDNANIEEISNTTTTKQQSPQHQDRQQDDIDLNALIEEAQEKQVTAKAWTSIFKAPEIPNCTFHKQLCLERSVTKKGPNFGRVFYICSKPTGPKDGPKDEQSCDFFQWKSTTK